MKKKRKKLSHDNAGKHKALKDDYAKHFEEIYFEFMSPGTSQKNGMV